MANVERIEPHQKAVEAGALDRRRSALQRTSSDVQAKHLLSPRHREFDTNLLENQALKIAPDQAILRLARALARRAAKEDHARACAERAGQNETRRDLRPLLDRSSK
jgi:hypothetical protein